MKFGTYIMPPEPIKAAYFINPVLNNTNITASHISKANLNVGWTPIKIFMKLGTKNMPNKILSMVYLTNTSLS
jgi:hypothetical protein